MASAVLQARDQGIRITSDEQWEAALLCSLAELQAAVLRLEGDAEVEIMGS